MATTQIQKRQIADGSIDDSKIGAGAGIATTKLAEGTKFLKNDGTVPLTGNLDTNGNRILNLPTPQANGDAANKQYVDTQITNALNPFTSKGTVRVATTANITLSAPQTIDGISVVAGDRVLVKNQSTASQNGVYVVAAGAWARAADMDVWAEIPGAWITVQQGTVNADTVWLATADQGGTLETTAITFMNPFAGLSTMSNSNFVDKEIPTGSINGSNATFTLANTPVSGSEHVFLNGALQESGAGNDYTISGTSLTFAIAPLSGEKIRISYRK